MCGFPHISAAASSVREFLSTGVIWLVARLCGDEILTTLSSDDD
jgi:hypothetical protein